MLFPPSPALSVCDSLDGIDDLDAFLAMQGSLSHFPTPPLKKIELVAATCTELVDFDDIHGPDWWNIASQFAEQVVADVESFPADLEAIRKILIRAELPIEVVALAFNIVAGLHRLTPSQFSPDLLVTAALSLAVSYTDDRPPTSRWWSRVVCDSTWTATCIDKAVLKLLEILDWQLHPYCCPVAIDRTVSHFGAWSDTLSEAETEPDSPPDSPVLETDSSTKCHQFMLPDRRPLKLQTSGTWTNWNHGQITPGDTPPCSALDISNHTPFRVQFLPLL